MKFMLSQSPAQVPVKYVSVQCRGRGAVLYGTCLSPRPGGVALGIDTLGENVRDSRIISAGSESAKLNQQPEEVVHASLSVTNLLVPYRYYRCRLIPVLSGYCKNAIT